MDKLKNFIARLFKPKQDFKSKQLQQAIYRITSVKPKNLSFYKLSLQHKSLYSKEESNERLEFLGDAVLSLVVGEYLYKKYPKEEGFLTEIRSRIVNKETLSQLAVKIGIDSLLRHKIKFILKESKTGIYCNALEAFIGALHLDHGYNICAQFITKKLLQVHIDLDLVTKEDHNYKSKMIIWAQKNKQNIQFLVVNTQTKKRDKIFTIQTIVGDEIYGEGSGNTKKQAEQIAAKMALEKLDYIHDRHCCANRLTSAVPSLYHSIMIYFV